MQTRFLSDEELRDTFHRAGEIAQQSREIAAPDAQFEAYLHAGEEMGLPREAVLQALREQMLIPGQSFTVGEMVFAPSMDGYWYPATITTLNDHTADVAFLNGGQHQCALGDLRPLSLVPGRKLEADLKDWGWYPCVVQRYEPDTGKLELLHDDWCPDKAKTTLKKVRLSKKIAVPEKQAPREVVRAKAALQRYALLAGGAGVVLGVVLDRLLPLLLPWLR